MTAAPPEPLPRPAGRLRAGRLSRALAPAGVFAASVLFQLPFFDRWFSVMDEGHMLEFADLLADGGMLYRDATSYPLPGAFYLLALAFDLFEPSIRLSRWLVVVEFGAFAALCFALLRRLVSPGFALAGVLLLWIYRAWAFPHWQMYGYATTALVFLVASLVALARFLESGRRGALAASGLLLGLGVFCKQDYGAAALVASVAALLAHARATRTPLSHSLAAFLLPAAAVGAAAGVHFWLQGQLGFVVRLTVLNHFVGLASYEYQAFPSLLPLFRQDPALRDVAGLHLSVPGLILSVGPAYRALVQSPLFVATPLFDTAVKLFVYGPFAWLAIGAVRLARRRGALRRPETRGRALVEVALFAQAAAVVLLAHVYRPQDYVHLAVLYWPLVCLGVVWAHALAASGRPGRLAVAVLAAGLLVFGAATASLLWQLRASHSEPLALERAGVAAEPGQARMLAEIVDYVRARSRPDQRVAAMPYFSLVQFLADRKGPHAASYIVWPFPEYPDRDRRIVEAMERHAVPLVIWNFTQFPHFPPVSEYAPELYAYLVDRFEMTRSFGDAPLGYRVAALERQAEPEGEPLLPDPRAAELFVESPEGSRRALRGAARARHVERAVWPFRPVWALRPQAGGGRTVLSVPVAPGGPRRLVTAVGVHPELWFAYPASSVRFELRAREEGAPDAVLLFSKTLDPHRELADRGWFPVDVPLDAFAGRALRLELSTAASGPSGASLLMGGWAEPRLVARSP